MKRWLKWTVVALVLALLAGGVSSPGRAAAARGGAGSVPVSLAFFSRYIDSATTCATELPTSVQLSCTPWSLACATELHTLRRQVRPLGASCQSIRGARADRHWRTHRRLMPVLAWSAVRLVSRGRLHSTCQPNVSRHRTMSSLNWAGVNSTARSSRSFGTWV